MKNGLQKGVRASGTDRLSPWLFLPLIVAVLAFVALIPMTWQQQAFFGVLIVVAAFLIDRSKRGPAATVLLVLLCLCATTRYGCVGHACRAPGVRPAGGACRGSSACASAIGRISTISRKTTAAVEAMFAPAVAVTPTGPRAYAQEDTVVEIARPIKADRRARIRCVVIITVGTHRLDTDANVNLCVSRRHHCQGCE